MRTDSSEFIWREQECVLDFGLIAFGCVPTKPQVGRISGSSGARSLEETEELRPGAFLQLPFCLDLSL